MDASDTQLAVNVSWRTIGVIVLLATFKLVAGIVAHSAAVISDAVHSYSDVFSAFIVMIGVRLAARSSDSDHQYGHERLECVAAIILSIILGATGAIIGWSALAKITASEKLELAIPGGLALVAALVSIITQETLYWYTRAAALKTNSSALLASAWHHRSDALSSIGSSIGVWGARRGYAFLDPLACVVISLFILKAAYGIFMDAIEKMTDHACDETTVSRIRTIILAHAAVQAIDSLSTRLFGGRIYVDVEIAVDGTVSLAEAHHTAQLVHDAIEAELPLVKHCMIHVNPYGTAGEAEAL